MRFSTIAPGIVLMPVLTGAFADLATRKNEQKKSDPQKSLTLDPKVIASGFANDGQDVPTAGQVPSLTSTNNFINFCLTVPDLPLTNGKQITTGSCNPAPIGVIPSTDNMPSSKFTNPKNGDTIPANTAFTISMAIKNLETGNFVNAQENYFSAPQQVNGQGQIIGHSHVVVEPLESLTQTTPTDPKQFVFFKGLNVAAVNGVLTADVTGGLPAGPYRLCSINTSANHQPAIVPIAQHGSLDDCVYFTTSDNGSANGNGAATPPATSSAAAGKAATNTAAGSTDVTTTAAGAKATSTTVAGTKTTSTAASATTTKSSTANNNNNHNNGKTTNRAGRFRGPKFNNRGRGNRERRF